MEVCCQCGDSWGYRYSTQYATDDGKIIWDYDTAKEYQTTDGFKGKGGAIDGPSPVVADGMLFMNSGYGMFGQMAANFLLAFSVSD
jgi:polyvinyl alcohol dehydrogenase (cytochrome)